jgi:hypothetical protein
MRTQSTADRAEGQYLDIVDFITAHPDVKLTTDAYLNWERRCGDVDWGEGETAERAHISRFDQIALAATLPWRPEARTPLRHSVWLAELLRHHGAFYRCGHSAYVLDTAARWRRKGNHVELVGNRWPHAPNARVRKVLVPRVDRPTNGHVEPPAPTPVAVELDGVDPTPDELRSAAETAAAPTAPPPTSVPLAQAFTVEGIDTKVGGEVVIRYTGPDASALVIAKVTALVPVPAL